MKLKYLDNELNFTPLLLFEFYSDRNISRTEKFFKKVQKIVN